MMGTPAPASGGHAAPNLLDRFDDHWRDLPLRTRLTSAAALAATLTIVAVVSVAYVAVRHELRGQIDSQLRRQANEYHQQVQFQAQQGFPVIRLRPVVGETGAYVQVVSAQGQVQTVQGDQLPVSPRDVRLAASERGQRLRDARAAGHHVRVLSTPLINGYELQIGLPLADVDRQLHNLASAFAVLAIGGLALTVVASWGLVRRSMRPVKSLTEAAEQIATTRDLTLRISSYGKDELGRLASTFNTMLDALERSLHAQRQLVTDASHELRTPLASLRTNVEVLNDVDRLSPEQRRAVLAGIVSQLEELTGLVADVVELAKGETPPSAYEDVQLEELVENAVDRAGRHWPSVTFRLETRPVAVRGVPGRLDRAVANLLDNAAKFSPPGGTVEVALADDGTLTVADQGPGVPDEALPMVFDRFFRADEARALPGSGLGLAIVKQVVEAHGGSVGIGNRPGGGAVATLRLPVVAGDRPQAGVPMPVEETLFS
jgi:two-component system sensor histidine kinase MprB